jgi:hypothetical protein
MPAAPLLPHPPRSPALALFRRRPPERVDGIVIPASENLHKPASRAAKKIRSLRLKARQAAPKSTPARSSHMPSYRGRSSPIMAMCVIASA